MRLFGVQDYGIPETSSVGPTWSRALYADKNAVVCKVFASLRHDIMASYSTAGFRPSLFCQKI